MRKFIEFEIYEYMDFRPSHKFMAMEESEAQSFADFMSKNYSGGTTRVVRVLTKEEALQHVLNEIKSVVKRPTITTSNGSLDSIDVEFITSILEELEKCYK